MYFSVLMAHSWLRWIIMISLLIVLFRALYGWIKRSDYTNCDNIMGIILVGATHIQVLLGFWLYFFLSPMTTTPAPANFMKNPVLRYWKVEHFFIMIVFLILVQLGRSISKRRTTALRKNKVLSIFAILAFAVLLFGLPWSNKPYGRPLLNTQFRLESNLLNDCSHSLVSVSSDIKDT